MSKKKYQKRNGKYHTIMYDYTDSAGKRHYKSFTADTVQEMDRLTSQYTLDRQGRSGPPSEATISDVVMKYINTSEAVLSPSTVKAYTAIWTNHISDAFIGSIRVDRVTSTDLQRWISDLTASGLSAKTVSNSYGLMSAALSRSRPDFRPSVTLPRKTPSRRYTPSSDDVRRVIDAIDNPDLLAAVLLYAFGPMRRSEICALTWADVSGNRITISKAMVQDKDGKWVVKPMPKTESSFRTIEFPESVISRLPERGKPDERVVQISPAAVSCRFRRVVSKLDIPDFSLHDLRHYAASVLHAENVPEKYIMARGGWATDKVMMSVYTNVIDIEDERQQHRINDYFDSVLSDE